MGSVIPVTATLLATAWILASAAGNVPLAVAVGGLALPLAGALAVRRRSGRHRRTLSAGLALVAVALTSGLQTLWRLRPTPPSALLYLVEALGALAVLVPVLYAATYPRGGGTQ